MGFAVILRSEGECLVDEGRERLLCELVLVLGALQVRNVSLGHIVDHVRLKRELLLLVEKN